jgi:hypothetical protein
MDVVSWIIVGTSAAIAVACFVAVEKRAPRRVAVALLFAAALPLAIAVAAIVASMLDSFRTIETLKAPTPKDLAGGVRDSVVRTALGVAGSAMCLLCAAIAYVRSTRSDVADAPADEAPPV